MSFHKMVFTTFRDTVVECRIKILQKGVIRKNFHEKSLQGA